MRQHPLRFLRHGKYRVPPSQVLSEVELHPAHGGGYVQRRPAQLELRSSSGQLNRVVTRIVNNSGKRYRPNSPRGKFLWEQRFRERYPAGKYSFEIKDLLSNPYHGYRRR